MRLKKKDLSHPLILSLIGIFIGSIIIPLVSSLYSDYRFKVMKKNEIAFSVIESNQLSNSKLNNVLTSIELFNKNCSIYKDKESLVNFQKLKNNEATTLYLEFNQSAWHWQMGLFQKMRTLGYDEKAIDMIRKLMLKYKAKLVARTNLLNKYWNVSLRKDLDIQESKDIGANARKEFNLLEEENNTIIFEVAQFLKN